MEQSDQADPVAYLQQGSELLVKSSNQRYVGLVLTVFGGALYSHAIVNDPYSIANPIGAGLVLIGSGLSIGSIINERKGLERLYVGMNGITVKLN